MITAPVLDMSPRAAPFSIPSTPASPTAAKGGKHLSLILMIIIGCFLLITAIISMVVMFLCKSNKEQKNEPAKETGMYRLLVYMLPLVFIPFFYFWWTALLLVVGFFYVTGLYKLLANRSQNEFEPFAMKNVNFQSIAPIETLL